MNRVVLTLDTNGEISGICADAPLEIYFNSPHARRDRVYRYGAAEFGPRRVQAAIGGHPVGHAGDGMLGQGDGTGKLPPSTPRLTDVSNLLARLDSMEYLAGKLATYGRLRFGEEWSPQVAWAALGDKEAAALTALLDEVKS